MTIDLNQLMLALAFLKPMDFDSGRLWMLLPLALAIAVVYKTSRLDDLRAVPVASLLLWGTILGGMFAVAIALSVIILIFR